MPAIVTISEPSNVQLGTENPTSAACPLVESMLLDESAGAVVLLSLPAEVLLPALSDVALEVPVTAGAVDGPCSVPDWPEVAATEDGCVVTGAPVLDPTGATSLPGATLGATSLPSVGDFDVQAATSQRPETDNSNTDDGRGDFILVFHGGAGAPFET